MTHKVLTIGDAMITMNPMTKGPLRSVTHFERKIGGAELNFAVACARLGLSCRWISRLGNDEFGRVIYNFARGEGLDMSAVTFVDGFPTSINFKSINEDGSGETFYYRFQSPILTLTVEDIKEDWFDDIQLVHLTGVFLAIAPNNREIVRKIIHCAKKRNIPISFDPNLRLKLWPIEKAAGLCKALYYHTRAPRNLTSNKPIQSPEDLKGFKMRVPNVPLFLNAWKAAGANPQVMDFNLPTEEVSHF